MGDKSKIEWTDATWNPIRGCSRVSEGCRNCYAERVASRFSGAGLAYEGLTTKGKWNGNVMLVDGHLEDPLRWKKPRKIFVNSMSDLFHENVSDDWIDQIFAVMALCPQHTFQVLTKRPERMVKYFAAKDSELRTGLDYRMQRWYRAAQKFMDIDDFPEHGGDWDWTMNEAGPLPNVWLGVSIEDQATADARISHLLKTPAAVRFLSYEPALGAVDLTDIRIPLVGESYETFSALHAVDGLNQGSEQNQLDWVICGGESGPGARPMHPDWARSVRDQCVVANVPFFFKQWGEWQPDGEYAKTEEYQQWREKHPDSCITEGPGFNHVHTWGEHVPRCSFRVGKAAAGRQLDGREWNEFPEVKAVNA